MSILNNTEELSIKDLSLGFSPGLRLFDHLNLSFPKQAIYTIIGTSGAGKTTFLNCLAGIQEMEQGTIYYRQKIFDPGQHKIGIVPQEYGLLPWHTVERAMCIHLRISQKEPRLSFLNRQKVKLLLEELQLYEKRKAYPNQLSGGQKQRLSLAKAFVIDPEMLLMDEPFSALDAFTREKVQRLFLKTWSDHPVLSLFVTHDIEEALLLGDHILLFTAQENFSSSIEMIENPLRNFSFTDKKLHPDFWKEVKNLRRRIGSDE